MIRKQKRLVTHKRKVSRGTNPADTLTIHETANLSVGADADAHARLQEGPGAMQASWHAQVDDKEFIQSYEYNQRCWHAGKANGNNTSIALEICVNADGIWTKTYKNAAEAAAIMLFENDLTVSDMVQHHFWTGKNCPTKLRLNNNKQWNTFKQDVQKNLDILKGKGSAPAKPAPKPVVTPSPVPKNPKVYSIVDYLVSQKKDSSFAARKKLAAQYGIANYTGTAMQNISLLGMLQKGTKPVAKPAPAPAKPAKSISQMATEVIQGKHGNGHANRQKSLGVTAAVYGKVRAEVNRRM